MNQSKTLPKILIFLMITLMCFGFISTVQARVTMRPIEHWLLNNPTGTSGNFVNNDYTINIGNPFFFPILQDEIFLVDGETTFDGYILERVLNDGSAELTVNLWVYNAPLTIYNFQEWRMYVLWWLGIIPGPISPPNAIIGAYEDGYIDYYYQYVFTLPSPGIEIPSMWDIYFSGAEIRMKTTGKGYGTFSENAAPFFTPGATGMVTLNQMSLTMPQLEGLEINKLYGTELWPVELINVQQIG
jgi:hypothetical protein